MLICAFCAILSTFMKQRTYSRFARRIGGRRRGERRLRLPARNLKTVALSPAIAAETARIRAAHQLKTPFSSPLLKTEEPPHFSRMMPRSLQFPAYA